MLIGQTAASGKLKVSNVKLPKQLTAGSEYNDTIEVTYTGETDIVAYMKLDITAENTNTKGINLTYKPDKFIIQSGETQYVDVKLETSHALVPDNFTYNIQAVSNIPVKTVNNNQDNSDSHGTTIISGNKLDLGPNSTFRNTYGDKLNKSEIRDLEERLWNFTNKAQNIIENKSEKIRELKHRNKELRDKLNSTGNKTKINNPANREVTFDIVINTTLTYIENQISKITQFFNNL